MKRVGTGPRKSAARLTEHVRASARALRTRERANKKRLKEAKAAWKSLTAGQQFELISQAVESRREELRSAYLGVQALGIGYGTYHDNRSGRRKVWPEPCITFLVRSKRRHHHARLRRPGDVPEHLLAHYPVKGVMTLCAMPTDVEDRKDFRLQAQNARVIVTDGAAAPVTGGLTCLVQRPDDPNVYALSCRHVLGMGTEGGGDYPTGAEVSAAKVADELYVPDPPSLANVVAVYGLLNDGVRTSFDVAMALVVGDSPKLHATLPSITASPGQKPYAEFLDDIRAMGTYNLRSPEGDLEAQFLRGWSPDEQMAVNYGDGMENVYQGVLVVESQLRNAATKAGFSGSPMVSKDGTCLLGMHFAGTGDKSFMIPAYELVRTGNYVQWPQGQNLNIL